MTRLQRRLAEKQRRQARRQLIKKISQSLFKIASIGLITSAFILYIVSLPESISFFSSKTQSEVISISFDQTMGTNSLEEEDMDALEEDIDVLEVALEDDETLKLALEDGELEEEGPLAVELEEEDLVIEQGEEDLEGTESTDIVEDEIYLDEESVEEL